MLDIERTFGLRSSSLMVGSELSVGAGAAAAAALAFLASLSRCFSLRLSSLVSRLSIKNEQIHEKKSISLLGDHLASDRVLMCAGRLGRTHGSKNWMYSRDRERWC